MSFVTFLSETNHKVGEYGRFTPPSRNYWPLEQTSDYNLPMNIDWRTIFVPSAPILEIIIRGTMMYLVLFVVLRLTFKRIGSSSIDLGDMLMIALVAAASQNAMAREHVSVADGIILVATISGWSYALDWLGTRSPRFQRFYNPPALLLV